jgi:hypothetical protein
MFPQKRSPVLARSRSGRDGPCAAATAAIAAIATTSLRFIYQFTRANPKTYGTQGSKPRLARSGCGLRRRRRQRYTTVRGRHRLKSEMAQRKRDGLITHRSDRTLFCHSPRSRIHRFPISALASTHLGGVSHVQDHGHRPGEIDCSTTPGRRRRATFPEMPRTKHRFGIQAQQAWACIDHTDRCYRIPSGIPDKHSNPAHETDNQ